jgi:uncharacterized repeat protein (TIGR03803 family)
MTRSKSLRYLANPLGLAIAITVTTCVLWAVAPAAQAETFQVIHNFTGGTDGYYPDAGIVRDQAGNLYGTTVYGGNYTSSCTYEGTQTGCGVVYKMTQHGSGWIFNALSSFDGANGYSPEQLITIAPNGALYGTTFEGGGSGNCHYFGPGCGTVFRLQPPATFCHAVSCPWTVSDLHQFQGQPDGSFPALGSLTIDSAGNLYGTTETGGVYNYGMVYELSPSPTGWTMSVLLNFYGYNGQNPEGGVIFDNAGNLYGVTTDGGADSDGAVYELTLGASGWTETVLHSFNYETDGVRPTGNLVMDAAGNLYGTSTGDTIVEGNVWELSPANGNWNLSVLHSFSGDYSGPLGGLLMDSAGNLYGASFVNGYGNVFKLSPGNGGWNYTSLHDFTGGSDGGYPYSNLAMDSEGNLFGVADIGGSSQNCSGGCGVVFEITP